MENIIAFKGNVKYQITLDPGVWIFDDRRVDLTTYFMHENIRKNELEEYTKAVSKHWDREIMEGAVFPPTLKTEKKFEKEKVLTGTFGIPFKPFLMNAEPDESAEIVVIESEDGETSLTLSEAEELILGFSKDGKPLKEDGPVHAYLGDGSNYNSPIRRVKAFRVE
ncbi:peptidyl-prolyl cis-trans isomerase [Cytobacillus firmus]|uniref:peptidyl-prolyl cis-trans isomerase n=1 Tax=Cytobacillus firmus TaxID=1399 RepID=UPI001C93992A|nr:peptidyl-prolyl cis-trans isomerase [Cytobacillus firmus]MBY6050504.1 peptidyl-prolyl cis-trans isomerase [Cytobacillus firmus]USK40503.1 peptidyl-prolyl cis-trans isomerase [Cytobacillus firmus]